MMKEFPMILGIALFIAILLLLTRSRANPIDSYSGEGFTEEYGGNRQSCEDKCFSSQYYDACLHVCMDPTGAADFTGRGQDFSVPSIGAPIPLEDENPEMSEYVSTTAGPYIMGYPGR